MSKWDPNAVSRAHTWATRQVPAKFATFARGYLRWKMQTDGPETQYPAPPSLERETVERCIRIRHKIDEILEGKG